MTSIKEQGVEGTFPNLRGFDFLYGRWQVRHTKLRERLACCERWFNFSGTLEVGPILGGRGNFDYNELEDPDGPYLAHSLRLYSASDDTWSVWWIDGRDTSAKLGPPVSGRFEGKKVWLYGDDTFRNKPIRVRTTYEPLDSEHAQWTQAFQKSDGDWEINWIMDFTRAGA